MKNAKNHKSKNYPGLDNLRNKMKLQGKTTYAPFLCFTNSTRRGNPLLTCAFIFFLCVYRHFYVYVSTKQVIMLFTGLATYFFPFYTVSLAVFLGHNI